MAAAGALNVVKQIQALAEGPQTPEMRECLGQVASSLLFFLDHPDSRVRLSAARTLLKLSTGYREDMQRCDMSRARSALERCKKAAAEGTVTADAEELRGLLAEMLEEAKPQEARQNGAASSSAAPAAAAAASSAPGAGGGGGGGGSAPAEDARGQVVLNVGHSTDGKLKAAILEKVVVLVGVVSVTFEGAYVIVATKTPAVAADAGFLADLLTAVKAQGLQGVSLVSASAGGPSGTGAGSSFAGGAGTFAGPGTSSGGACPQAATVDDEVPLEVEEDDDEAEPAYLDDDEDEDAGPDAAPAGGLGGAPVGLGLGAGQANWSFFSQNNWMTGRRVQEFGDDPTIAARLAKAKKREEEKREEERSRMGRLSSWLMGGR